MQSLRTAAATAGASNRLSGASERAPYNERSVARVDSLLRHATFSFATRVRCWNPFPARFRESDWVLRVGPETEMESRG